jgi:hypothetical protein
LNDQFKENEMGMACSKHGEKRNAYGILVGKPEATEKPGHSWEYNI